MTRLGKLLLAHGYTWDAEGSPAIEPQSLFRMGSLSKPLTATAMLRLAQDGVLSLADRLADWLPIELPGDARLEQISLLDLLQHLGGWDSQASFDPLFYDPQIARQMELSLPLTIPNILDFMSAQPLQSTPGAAFHYSNFGYLLLGMVIEAASGKPYSQALQELVFSPLGASGFLSRAQPPGTAPGWRGDVFFHV